MELLLGCGSSRVKKLWWDNRNQWIDCITLDVNPDHNPNIVYNLDQLPLPFEDNKFDEIHAYDVLEHTGKQGDFAFFFAQWSDFWRMLKPGGLFFGISPAPSSPWAWGDPGHTRIITPESFAFLSQPNYGQVGSSPMTDYRKFYQADFQLLHSDIDVHQQHSFALTAVKPARIVEDQRGVHVA